MEKVIFRREDTKFRNVMESMPGYGAGSFRSLVRSSLGTQFILISITAVATVTTPSISVGFHILQ